MTSQSHISDQAIADRPFAQSMRRIEGLVEQIERIDDPHARELARGLTQALLDLHAQGFRRMLDNCDDTASQASVRQSWLDDPLVSNLLVLHGLHPLELNVRIVRALEQVAPRLADQNASVTVLAATEQGVHLRLASDPSGCPSSVGALRQTVEDALVEWAADIVSVTWDEQSNRRAPAGFVPLACLSGQ